MSLIYHTQGARLTLPGDVEKHLTRYADLVIRFNRKLNLVARRGTAELVARLCSESLLPLQWDVCRLASPMLDIGTGAGFPGLPLKLARPELSLVLLDANRRKTLFLRRAVEELELEGVEVVWGRAERYAAEPSRAGRFGTVVSRAACPLQDLVGWAGVLLCEGGELVAWKGSGGQEELKGLRCEGLEEGGTLVLESGLRLMRFVRRPAAASAEEA